jgi:protein-tyrosine phosphatase
LLRKKNPKEKDMRCSVCKTPNAQHACSQCELIAYCGEACQTKDWVTLHHLEHSADKVIQLGSIWVGGLEALKDKALMENVQAVVTALPIDSRFDDSLIELHLKGKARLIIPVKDKSSHKHKIAKHFDLVADFINSHAKVGHNVLVHCAAGMSRSATLVVAYMLKYLNYRSVEKAISTIRKKRDIINPNEGFRQVLEEYNKKLHG